MYDRHCRDLAELFFEDWESERGPDAAPLPATDREMLLVAFSQEIQDAIERFLAEITPRERR